MNENEMQIIGLELDVKTINLYGQSAIDITKLWGQFEKNRFTLRFPTK